MCFQLLQQAPDFPLVIHELHGSPIPFPQVAFARSTHVIDLVGRSFKVS